MFYKNILKRVAPFLLTFAAGVFIASFFVTIAAPNFNMRPGRGSHKYREMQRLRIENRELREEKARMARELEVLRMEAASLDSVMPLVPVVDIDTPRAPQYKGRVYGSGTGSGYSER